MLKQLADKHSKYQDFIYLKQANISLKCACLLVIAILN